MSKKVLLMIIFIILVVVFAGYKLIVSKTGNIAGLLVTSDPVSSVFLNDKLVGKTPYEEKVSAGEYVIKLIPEASATQASSWQGKIKLQPSLLTYINRTLGPSELTSSGNTVTLEKVSRSEAQLTVFSQPDASTVLLDGQERGVTPFNLIVTAGKHDVAVVSPGYIGRSEKIEATIGYKVVINFQLALQPNTQPPATDVTPTLVPGGEKKKSGPFVVIKETPTGFLRVRMGPSTSATEAAQVKPGEKYSLLEEKEGWYKISIQEGKEGWISGRYAEKSE